MVIMSSQADISDTGFSTHVNFCTLIGDHSINVYMLDSCTSTASSTPVSFSVSFSITTITVMNPTFDSSGICSQTFLVGSISKDNCCTIKSIMFTLGHNEWLYFTKQDSGERGYSTNFVVYSTSGSHSIMMRILDGCLGVREKINKNVYAYSSGTTKCVLK